MIARQFLTIMTLVLMLLNPLASFAKDDAQRGIVDDSIRDMSIVFGAGAAGAVLGLSTLSFVDEPSKHLKNIGIGGALGIVIGVTAVIFSQASRTSLAQATPRLPITAEEFKSLSKEEFKISPFEKTAVASRSDALRILLPF